mmetsp:Transcript_13398/g.22830  ORF Transcript_13398/g.22830 Transcript_13398/m.22830 type:complete len:80 (-) Transcript_13398:718-957(-)
MVRFLMHINSDGEMPPPSNIAHQTDQTMACNATPPSTCVLSAYFSAPMRLSFDYSADVSNNIRHFSHGACNAQSPTPRL